MYPQDLDPALLSGMHIYSEPGHTSLTNYVSPSHAYWSHMQSLWHMSRMGYVPPAHRAFDSSLFCPAPLQLQLPLSNFIDGQIPPLPEDAEEGAVENLQDVSNQQRQTFTKSKLRKQRRQRLRQAIQAAAVAENASSRPMVPLLEEIRDSGHEAFIRERLCEAPQERLDEVFNRAASDVCALASDGSGYMVLLHLLNSARPQQKQVLVEQLFRHFTPLVYDLWGCRVLQRVLEVATRDQQVLLADGLRGQVLRCSEHQHANFVVQKCIEQMGGASLGFIVDDIQGHVKRLAQHEYGCRVLQRLFEFLSTGMLHTILEEVIANVPELSENKFGNYVVQQVLQKGRLKHQQAIITQIADSLAILAKNKFSSRVVERCFETVQSSESAYELREDRRALMRALLERGQGMEPLVHELVNDQYGNYVVQQAIRGCEDHEDQEHRQLLSTCTALPTMRGNRSLNRHAEATIAAAEAAAAALVLKKTRGAIRAVAPLSHGG